jgi:competence protein ComGF
MERSTLNTFNKDGFMLIEVLFSLALLAVMGSALLFSLLTIVSTSFSIGSELQHEHTLLFVHDIFEDDTTPPLLVQSCSERYVLFSNESLDTVEYTFSSGRIGRSLNGKRREYLTPEQYLHTFHCEQETNLLKITLETNKGFDHVMEFSTQ